MNSKNETLAWITLFHTKGIGNKRLMALITHFKSAICALNADDQAWKDVGIPPRYIATRHLLDHSKILLDQQFLEKPQCSLLTFNDDDYPALLMKISDPPALLYLCGNRSLLNQPQIAVVGTRHPSKEGIQNAKHFSGNLAKNGFVIVSGLALGIDTIAHQAVIDHNKPTIAVLGTGINQIYPQSNRQLAKEILQKNGLIISEFHNGTPPIAENFPKRNRIIAGLALGTLVVEAALKSGSLITARLSFEENRDVFTIPYSIYNPQAKGCHYLIKQGAQLVENVIEIIDEFRNWLPMDWQVNIESNQAILGNISSDISSDISNNTQQSIEIPSNISNPALIIKKKAKNIQTSEKSSTQLISESEAKLHHPQPSNTPLKNTMDATLAPILALFESQTLTIDQLIDRSDFDSSFITHALLMLELEGTIEALIGGNYRRC